MNKALTTMLLAALLSAGCAQTSTSPGTGSTLGSLIAIEYGTVRQVEQVNMAPNYGTSTLVGGGIGLAAASRHSASSQAGAAIAGALIAALIAKSNAGTADKYTVSLGTGRTVAIVTEHHDISVGDCVAVEQGDQAERAVTAHGAGEDGLHGAISTQVP